MTYPDEFEIFWSEVIRKEPSKAKAYDSWRRALKREDEDGNPWTADAILAGLRKFIPAWEVMEPDKVPHITTWLNQDRWTATPVMPRVRVLAGPSQPSDEAMQAWLKLVREIANPGSEFPDKRMPSRIYDAAMAVGGVKAIDPAKPFQCKTFCDAYRAWSEVAS